MIFRFKRGKVKGEKFLKEVTPIFAIENDVIILKDGRVAVGYQVYGSSFESLQANQYEHFCKTFDRAFCGLPTDYIVQKTDVYANCFFREGREPENFKEKGFFERESINYFSNRPVLKQTSYLFVISNSLNNRKSTTFANTFLWGDKVQSRDFKNIAERIREAVSKGNSFMESLNASGQIKSARLNTAQMKALEYQLLNCEFKDSVNAGVAPYKNMYNDLSAFVIGERKINVTSMEQMGEEIFYSIPNDYGLDAPYMYRLGIYLQFPHVTVCNWWKEDTLIQLKKLDRQRNQQAVFSKVGGQSADIKQEELSNYTAHVRANDLKFISVSIQVITFPTSERAREEQLQCVRDAMRATCNTEPLLETFDNASSFFSCLPGGAAQNIRWVLTTNEMASCFANFTNEFISKNQGDYICDRFRNLVYLDLFDRSLNNQNAICIGPSGSGKSFTMGHFIVQRYERKERQNIIDVGGTYRNIFENLGSNDLTGDVRYFEYNPENPISFNPFLIDKDKEGNYSLSDDKSGVLLTLLSLLIKGKEGKFSQIEWPILQHFIELYYQQLNLTDEGVRPLPNLENFILWLKEYVENHKDNPAVKMRIDRINYADLGFILEPYITGKYRKLLNSPELLNISDYRLVCFDMARIKDDKILYPVISFLLIELILDVIRKYPDDKKHFMMDEAWSMLSESMGEFVEYLYRTIRKCNGSMTIITQGIDELETIIGATIKSKCETKIILNHTTDAEIKKMGIGMGLTTAEMQKVASIRVNKECRELFIKQGAHSNVFVLEVPPQEHAVLTSNPVERNHLNKLKFTYKNLQFAIRQWVEDKNKGVFDGI